MTHEPIEGEAARRVLELKAQEIPEGVVVRGIERYLQLRKIEYTRTLTTLRFVGGAPGEAKQVARNPQRGLPDIIGTFPWGQAFAFECKRPGGRLRPAQAEWILRQPPFALILIPEASSEVIEIVDPLLARWSELHHSVTGQWSSLLMGDRLWRERTKLARDQAAYRLHGSQFRKKLARS